MRRWIAVVAGVVLVAVGGWAWFAARSTGTPSCLPWQSPQHRPGIHTCNGAAYAECWALDNGVSVDPYLAMPHAGCSDADGVTHGEVQGARSKCARSDLLFLEVDIDGHTYSGPQHGVFTKDDPVAARAAWERC